jgi:mono/diheme cytochrome c family protein
MTSDFPRRRSGRLLAVGAALVATAGFALAGCGSDSASDKEDVSENADLANGKQLFATSCGGCHVLQDAGTVGRIGPNLDDAFRGSRQAGFPESQFEGVTLRWIQIANQPMPRDLVTGQDATDVAAYVASVAGESEESDVASILPWVAEDVQTAMPSGFRKDRFAEQSQTIDPAPPPAPEGGTGEGETPPGPPAP